MCKCMPNTWAAIMRLRQQNNLYKMWIIHIFMDIMYCIPTVYILLNSYHISKEKIEMGMTLRICVGGWRQRERKNIRETNMLTKKTMLPSRMNSQFIQLGPNVEATGMVASTRHQWNAFIISLMIIIVQRVLQPCSCQVGKEATQGTGWKCFWGCRRRRAFLSEEGTIWSTIQQYYNILCCPFSQHFKYLCIGVLHVLLLWKVFIYLYNYLLSFILLEINNWWCIRNV